MKTINSSTKQAKGFIWRYLRASITDIKQAYNKSSKEKIRAFNNCRSTCFEESGAGFRILGRSPFYFTVAWQVGNNLKVDTGRNVYLILNAF